MCQTHNKPYLRTPDVSTIYYFHIQRVRWPYHTRSISARCPLYEMYTLPAIRKVSVYHQWLPLWIVVIIGRERERGKIKGGGRILDVIKISSVGTFVSFQNEFLRYKEILSIKTSIFSSWICYNWSGHGPQRCWSATKRYAPLLSIELVIALN